MSARSGASFARGASRQDYSTPPEFIAAVERRFGPIDFDLAASAENAKAKRWFGPGGEAEDALAQPWTRALGEHLWLNPPFADIAPWAEKCAEAVPLLGNATISLLVPAAVGSNWFRDFVFDSHARVYLLNGRISFDGKAPYPKDCLLARYGAWRASIEVWSWRGERSTKVTP